MNLFHVARSVGDWWSSPAELRAARWLVRQLIPNGGVVPLAEIRDEPGLGRPPAEALLSPDAGRRRVEDKNELVAAGEAVAIIPGGLHGIQIRPDLTTIPLHGVAPSHVILATRAGDRSRLVAAFRRSAQECLTAPAPQNVT